MTMPNLPMHAGPILRATDTIIRDINGEIIATLTAEEMTVHYPDGRVVNRKKLENIELVDGTGFNAGMMLANPPVQIGVCHFCRHPPYTFPVRDKPTHGLIRLSRAKTCTCGMLCCRKHRQLCRDGIVRCPPCTRRWFWKEAVLGIFFSRS
jgi:hypothetical protein